MDLVFHVQTFYRSAGYTLHPPSCQVVSADGVEQTVRPKTFQLLMLLIEARGVVQSKEHILKTIWNDVVVDEQVIFQSIKELRKIFSGSEVIKNYPRKGYAWVPRVDSFNETDLQADKHAESFVKSQKFSRKTILFTASLILLIVAVSFYLFNETVETVNGSIIVLPVQTDMADSDHKWVRYGGMDQLIQRLSSTEHHGVLQTDYVLEILSRAKIPKGDIDSQQIGQIFQVSGAGLVIQLNLTGTVQDYQLIYSFHQRNQLVRGAVLDSSIAGAIDQVGDIVVKRLGQNELAGKQHYRSAFANEMLANGLESFQNNDINSAITLLKAAIATEPTNIEAKRILIRILVERQESEQAQVLLDQAILQAIEKNNTKELVRLYFWQGASYAQQGKLETALETLSLAKLKANEIKDWLLLAYIAEISGRVYQFKQEYSDASKQFNEAMSFHEVLQCPYGQSNVLLLQSQLSFEQNNVIGALASANDAYTLIQHRQLGDLKEQAETWLETVKSKQNEQK